MLRAIFLFLFLNSAFTAVPQSSGDLSLNDLAWNEYYKLQWDDFQGKPDPQSLGDAATAVVIRAKPFLVRKKVHYEVVAIFDRGKSWARDRSLSLLAHEQVHFDIAELYARKIRKRVSELSAIGERDIGIFNREIHKLLQESNDVDAQYDIETLHGALSRKQAEWSESVKAQLADLRQYKRVKRVIGKP